MRRGRIGGTPVKYGDPLYTMLGSWEWLPVVAPPPNVRWSRPPLTPPPECPGRGGGKAFGCLSSIVGFLAVLTLFSYWVGRSDSGAVGLMTYLLGALTVLLAITFLLGWVIIYAGRGRGG